MMRTVTKFRFSSFEHPGCRILCFRRQIDNIEVTATSDPCGIVRVQGRLYSTAPQWRLDRQPFDVHVCAYNPRDGQDYRLDILSCGIVHHDGSFVARAVQRWYVVSVSAPSGKPNQNRDVFVSGNEVYAGEQLGGKVKEWQVREQPYQHVDASVPPKDCTIDKKSGVVGKITVATVGCTFCGADASVDVTTGKCRMCGLTTPTVQKKDPPKAEDTITTGATVEQRIEAGLEKIDELLTRKQTAKQKQGTVMTDRIICEECDEPFGVDLATGQCDRCGHSLSVLNKNPPKVKETDNAEPWKTCRTCFRYRVNCTPKPGKVVCDAWSPGPIRIICANCAHFGKAVSSYGRCDKFAHSTNGFVCLGFNQRDVGANFEDEVMNNARPKVEDVMTTTNKTSMGAKVEPPKCCVCSHDANPVMKRLRDIPVGTPFNIGNGTVVMRGDKEFEALTNGGMGVTLSGEVWYNNSGDHLEENKFEIMFDVVHELEQIYNLLKVWPTSTIPSACDRDIKNAVKQYKSHTAQIFALLEVHEYKEAVARIHRLLDMERRQKADSATLDGVRCFGNDTAHVGPWTTVRACLDCGVLVTGGPTRCRYCADKQSQPKQAEEFPIIGKCPLCHSNVLAVDGLACCEEACPMSGILSVDGWKTITGHR